MEERYIEILGGRRGQYQMLGSFGSEWPWLEKKWRTIPGLSRLVSDLKRALNNHVASFRHVRRLEVCKPLPSSLFQVCPLELVPLAQYGFFTVQHRGTGAHDKDNRKEAGIREYYSRDPPLIGA